MKARTFFDSEEDKKQYVSRCDEEFEKRLDGLMKQVCSCEDTDFVTLSGPTCSGKTTASKKLISEFHERGKRIKTVSLDDFFRNAAVLKKECEGGVLDFDSEKALDTPVLEEFMYDLQKKGEARLPRFDFKSASRTHFEDFSAKDADIILFEGIQATYPVFTGLFEKDARVRGIYISVLDSLDVNGRIIGPREIRLWRRIVRDFKFRAASPEYSFDIWKGVVKNEDKNILPYAERNDFKLDSLQGYGPCMLKKELVPLMKSVDVSSEYYEKSVDILRALEGIEEIDSAYLPANSLYHEFI